MRIHTCVVVCPGDEVRRQDRDEDADLLAALAAEAYRPLLATETDLSIKLDGMNLQGRVLRRSGRVAGLFYLEVADAVGLGGLLLSGKRGRPEQSFAIEFQKRMSFDCWCLPLPPLEITARPLLYVVLFRLGGPHGGDWYAVADKVVRAATGLALAFVRAPRR